MGAALALDGAAWGGGGLHVPDPTDSGPVAAVAGDNKSATLAFALGRAGASHEEVARACGVSRQRVQQWCDPDNDAAINLTHMLDAPPGVRRAIGEALVASASAKVLPVPLHLYEAAALGVLAKVSALTARVENLRASGDLKARNAALREISDLRAALDRIEAGVMMAAKGAR